MKTWKKALVVGGILLGLALVFDVAIDMWAPASGSTVAVQQADDTTAAHIATRQFTETVGFFTTVSDVTKVGGLVLILVSVVLYLSTTLTKTETKNETTEGVK